MKIVPSTEADYEFARSVHHQACKEMVLRQYGAWNLEVQDTFFERTWKRLPHSIIWNGDRLCGYCCIEEAGDSIHLREIAISPDCQNAGIGTALLKDFIERGRRRNLRIRLNVMKTNVAAKRFYERMGFRTQGESDTHFLMEISE